MNDPSRNTRPTTAELKEVESLRQAIRQQFDRELPDEHLLQLARRNFRNRAIHRALDTMTHSWSIVKGNADDIARVTDLFQKPGGYRQFTDGGKKYVYQLLILRAFHNFLASAVATKEHACKAMQAVKRVHPDVDPDFEHHLTTFEQHDHVALAKLLRNYSLHVGPQSIGLNMHMVGSPTDDDPWSSVVFFDTAPLRAEWAEKLKVRKPKQGTRDALALIDRIQPRVVISAFAASYVDQADRFLRELRQRLLAQMQQEEKRLLALTNPDGDQPTLSGDNQ